MNKKLILYTGKHCFACISYCPMIKVITEDMEIPLEIIDLHTENDPYNAHPGGVPALVILYNNKVWADLVGAFSERRVIQWLEENI